VICFASLMKMRFAITPARRQIRRTNAKKELNIYLWRAFAISDPL